MNRGRRSSNQEQVKLATEATPSEYRSLDFVNYDMPGHLIRRLEQIAVRLFAEGAERCGSDLTKVQYAALTAIRQFPRIDQASLAAVISYDRTTIGGVVDRLESKGLVRRLHSPTDRRLWQLVIEPAGEEHLRLLDGPVAWSQERILAPLTESERTQFLALARKLIEVDEKNGRPQPRTRARRISR